MLSTHNGSFILKFEGSEYLQPILLLQPCRIDAPEQAEYVAGSVEKQEITTDKQTSGNIWIIEIMKHMAKSIWMLKSPSWNICFSINYSEYYWGPFLIFAS